MDTVKQKVHLDIEIHGRLDLSVLSQSNGTEGPLKYGKEGLRKISILLGEKVEAVCTVKDSYPGADLSWTVSNAVGKGKGNISRLQDSKFLFSLINLKQKPI